ncbi:ABC transporter ATP-binding protein [Virgisporangium ochraceum]
MLRQIKGGRPVASDEELRSIGGTGRIFRVGFGGLLRGGRDEWRTFVPSVLAALVQGGAIVDAASGLGWVTSNVITPAFTSGHTGVGAAATAAAVIVGFSLLRVSGLASRRVLSGITQFRLQARYRRELTRRHQRLSLAWHRRNPPGQMLSTVGSDVEAVWSPMMPFPFAIGVLFMLLAGVAATVAADRVLALVATVLVPLIVAVNLVYQRRVAPRLRHAQQMRAHVASIAHESFEGEQVVRTLGLRDAQTRLFADAATRLRDANVRAGRVTAAFDPVVELLPTTGVLVVLLVGANRVAVGAMDTGVLIQVTYLLTTMAFPLQIIGRLLSGLPLSVVGRERVGRTLASDEELPYGAGVLADDGRGDGAGLHARLDGVGFGYDPAHPVVDGLDLDLPPGTVTAVVGATGAGKSTLVSLLGRLFDPAHGTVTYDGRDARDLAPGQATGAVALVAQQTFLFDDTVRTNVALDGPSSDDEIWRALRSASADRFVAALPHGLDTVLGERGATLSGGQRQRIALARAVVRRPRLLILDDATSALDTRVERDILARLRDAVRETTGTAGLSRGEATLLVVAYRRSSIVLADRVVFVHDGRITATGTHRELFATVPAYRDLVGAYDDAVEVDELARVVGT